MTDVAPAIYLLLDGLCVNEAQAATARVLIHICLTHATSKAECLESLSNQWDMMEKKYKAEGRAL